MEEILSLIPHRPPFLYVDRVIHISDNEIRAEKEVKKDEPFFKGHFPDFPIMPGVLICEAIFQTAAILISKLNQNQIKGTGSSPKIPVISRIKETKFKNMVRPGDLLSLTATLEEKISSAYFFKGTAKICGKTACSVVFSATTVAININEGTKS